MDAESLDVTYVGYSHHESRFNQLVAGVRRLETLQVRSRAKLKNLSLSSDSTSVHETVR